jgi:hypothetical protein
MHSKLRKKIIMINKVSAILGLLVLSAPAYAQEVNDFEFFKNMVGKWEGQLSRSTGEVVTTRSEFRLVSDGNTIVETLVEDGMEMLTTYSEKDGELIVKHYCSLGTEPIFSSSKSSLSSVALTLDPATGYKAGQHDFVSSMNYQADAADKDTIIQTSTASVEGMEQSNRAVLRRVK